MGESVHVKETANAKALRQEHFLRNSKKASVAGARVSNRKQLKMMSIWGQII